MDQGPSRRAKLNSATPAGTSGNESRIGDRADVSDWELVQLRPTEIHVDHRYQRPLDSRHVAELVRDFDPDLFGVANVSLRPDGKHFAVDGQHRCEAARVAGHGNRLFWFRVHRGLSLAQEADLFTGLNGKTKAISAVAMFNAMVIAKDPMCCAIVRILDSFGLHVAGYKRVGGISAVRALQRVYRGTPVSWRKPSTPAPAGAPDGHLLSRTLHILIAAWGKDRSAMDGLLIDAVAGLLNKHGTSVDAQTLANVLAKTGTAMQVIGKIRSYADATSKSPVAASVLLLESAYDKRKGRGIRLGKDAQ